MNTRYSQISDNSQTDSPAADASCLRSELACANEMSTSKQVISTATGLKSEKRHFMLNQLGAVQLSSDILAKANIGLWAFELDEGQPPRMYPDETMLKLLGLDHQLPPEEAYHAWYDHVDKDSYGLVNDAVAKMMAGEHAEVQYPWHCPDGHTIIVRCGGIRNFSYTKGIRVEGTHQNVTQTLHFDEEKRKELAESNARFFALEDNFEALYDVNLETGDYDVFVDGQTYSEKVVTKFVAKKEFFEDSYKNIDKVVHPEDLEDFKAVFNRDSIIKTLAGDSHFDYYYRLLVDNKPAWFRMRIVYKDAKKKNIIIGIFNAEKEHEAQQLSEQKEQLHEALIRNDALYHMIDGYKWSYGISANGNVVTAHYDDGIIRRTDANSPEDTMAWVNILHPDDRERVRSEFMAAVLDRSGNTPYETVYRMLGKDGSYIWARTSGRLIPHADGTAELFGMSIDITAQMEAQQKRLLGAMPLSNNVLAKANIGLWSFELDEGQPPRMYHDETMLKLVGLDHQLPPEDAYHAWYDHVDKDSYGLVNDAVAKMMAGEHAEVQYPWHCPDGRTIIVRCGGIRNFSYKKGIRVEGTHQDVTQTLHYDDAEEKRRRAETVKDQILSEITKARYGYNVTVNLKTLKCSVIRGTGCDGAVDIFERCSDYGEVVHEFIARITDEEALRRAKELFSVDSIRKAVAAGKSGFIGSTVYPTESANPGEGGMIGWRDAGLFIGTDSDGNPIANILGRNITVEHAEQERQEREREAAAAKDRILSEITRELYGYNLTVNLKTLKYTVITGTGMDAACEIFKSSDDYAEAIRLKLEFVVPHDRDRVAKLMEPDELKKKVTSGANVAIGTTVYEANVNGQHQWHETNVFIGTDANGDPIANILGRNITEEHEQADAAAQLLAAKSASEAKTKFLFSMSHDIRTPMNAIKGFTDIAMKNLDDRERLVDSLKKIDSSSNLLLSLINSVLDMSRVESGKAKIEENVGDVMLSFVNIEGTMQELAKAKGIALSFEFGNIADRYVFADQGRCHRVFLNIISNAIKYSKPNGYVKVRCEQIGEKMDGMASYRYTFQDNGIGMSEEFLGHVFEEFARERNSTTSGIQGTGLGLALSKIFVELMGGTIECMSKQGEGSTFIVTLPFKVQDKAEFIDPYTGNKVSADRAGSETAANSRVESNKLSFKDKRVLLVEDNELNREVATYMLEEEGFNVETAEDGSIAIRIVQEKGIEYYDFILMDIQMPIIGGYEATRQLRADGFKRPIIALSANAFDEDRAASLAAGMNDHVAKPIKINELFSALAKFL